jgi:hypothetical protein
MTSLTHPLREITARESKTPVFRTVLVYENLDAGLGAKRFCDGLERNLGVQCQTNNQVWRFDVLGIPEIRNRAASAAARADLVILSKTDQNVLPKNVSEWLDMWIWLIDQKKPALIALFGASRDGIEPVRTQLRNVTRNKGIDFFSTIMPQKVRSSGSPLSRDKSAVLRMTDHCGPFGKSGLDGCQRQPASGWVHFGRRRGIPVSQRFFLL